MDGRRATPCALKHPLSAYPAGVFYYESHALLHLVRADPTMASIGVSHLVKLDLATAAWRRQCAQCAPSCSPQSPYAHAIGPSYQNCGGEKACNREKAQP